MTKRICDFCGKDNQKQGIYMLDSITWYESEQFDGMDICNDCLKLLCQTIKKKRSEERCGIVR